MQDTTLTGPLVVVAVLVAATAFGLWRRRRDGRLRPVLARPAGHPTGTRIRPVDVSGAVASTAAPSTGASAADRAGEAAAGSTEIAGAHRPGDGAVADSGAPGMAADPDLLAALGVQPGTPATLLQFSSAFCTPCRATRRVLGEVTGMLDGVRHVEVDAESHLAEVRALNIWRTPTVLVVDATGRIVARATGVPSKPQVVATLAPLLSAAGSGVGESGPAQPGTTREGAAR